MGAESPLEAPGVPIAREEIPAVEEAKAYLSDATVRLAKHQQVQVAWTVTAGGDVAQSLQRLPANSHRLWSPAFSAT